MRLFIVRARAVAMSVFIAMFIWTARADSSSALLVREFCSPAARAFTRKQMANGSQKKATLNRNMNAEKFYAKRRIWFSRTLALLFALAAFTALADQRY